MIGLARNLLLIATVAQLALASPASSAAGDAPGLAQCATMKDAAARLACYDEMAAREVGGPAPAANGASAATAPARSPAPSTVPPPAPAPARGAPVAAAVAPRAPAPAPAAASPAISAAPNSIDRPENFGLSSAQLGTAQKDSAIQSIQAHVSELPGDQMRVTSVVLDNGQTWKCTDGDMTLSLGEAVTIRRAALGSFILVSASGRSFHVRRLR